MKTVARLAAAAALVTAAALAPGLAAADDDRGRWGDGPDRAWTDHRGGRHGDRHEDWLDDRGHGRRHGPGPGWDRGRDGLREQVRALRWELRRLDDDRAAFHARFGHRNHGKLARYDAWYFERRATLERRLERLTWYAWR